MLIGNFSQLQSKSGVRMSRTSPENGPLNNEIHNYHTRSNYQIAFNIIVTNNLFIPIARTTNYGLKLTKVIGPKIWNSIPWEIRKITSICGFKKSLKCYLLSVNNR